MDTRQNTIVVGAYLYQGDFYVSGISNPHDSWKSTVPWPWAKVVFHDNFLYIRLVIGGYELKYDNIDQVKRMFFGCVVKIVHHDQEIPKNVYLYGCYNISRPFESYLKSPKGRVPRTSVRG